MQEKKLKRRHHIIPKVYLKQWNDPNQPKRVKVYCLDKATLKGICTSPDNIFVNNHYFTEQELSGLKHHPVEDYLSEKTESRFPQLLSMLESHQAITEAMQKELWWFVASMFARVSWWREPLQSLIDPAFVKGKDQAVSQAVQRYSANKNRATRRQVNSSKYRREVALDVEKKASEILTPLAESVKTKLHPALVMASLTLEELQTYPCKVLTTDGSSVLSSDTPCFVEEDPVLLSLSEAETTHRAFVCPLSPKLVFVGGLGLTTGYRSVDCEWVQRFNARVRANAQDKLLANTNAVDESWFRSDVNSPPTMREVIEKLNLPAGQPQPKFKGFGDAKSKSLYRA